MLADECGINVAVGDSLAVSKLEVVLIHILSETLKGSALNGDASDSGVVNHSDVINPNFVATATLAWGGIGRNCYQQAFAINILIDVREWDGEFSPITSCDGGILGCGKFVVIILVFGILIVGAVGNDCAKTGIGVIAVDCTLGELHPHGNRIGATMHDCVIRVPIIIRSCVAKVHLAAVGSIGGEHTACI